MGRGADHTMHMSRARWARMHVCQAAFVSVVREMTFTSARSMDAIASILAKFQMPPSAMDDVRRRLQSLGALG
eukprot:8879587-Lingulodinium_polyedra.AAC.1